MQSATLSLKKYSLKKAKKPEKVKKSFSKEWGGGGE